MTSKAADETGRTAGTPATPGTGPNEVALPEAGGLLQGSQGHTKIADIVVQKIASVSARDVPGVRNLGGGTARTVGALRGRIPGAGTSYGQGVTVEVGERQVAVDLDLLIEFGVSIPDLARAVRQNVITAVEEMTGLQVVEVNITVVDVVLGGDADADPARTRVA